MVTWLTTTCLWRSGTPNSDSAEDLGTNTVRWRKLFADDIDVGNDISVAGDVTVSGTINATITGTSDNATALATACY